MLKEDLFSVFLSLAGSLNGVMIMSMLFPLEARGAFGFVAERVGMSFVMANRLMQNSVNDPTTQLS